jgi:hypothetical protein
VGWSGETRIPYPIHHYRYLFRRPAVPRYLLAWNAYGERGY